MRYLALPLLVALAAAVANAADPAFVGLLAAKSMRCSLDAGAQAEWKAGRAEVTKSSFGAGDLVFDSIDAKGGTARIIGGIGAADVAVIATQTGSHLDISGPYPSQFHGTCTVLE